VKSLKRDVAHTVQYHLNDVSYLLGMVMDLVKPLKTSRQEMTPKPKSNFGLFSFRITFAAMGAVPFRFGATEEGGNERLAAGD